MKRSVFVIMPIGGMDSAPEKIRIVQSAARRRNWCAHLPSYDPNAPAFDLVETIREMRSSSLILADLSGERPSCYYEIGLSEAHHLPVFAVAEQGTLIHQTSIRNEVRSYGNLGEFAHLVEQALSLEKRKA